MRRGTVYYWRRRFLRFSTGNIDLQVSLRTTERFRAAKLARKLSAESDRLMDAVAMNRISAQEAVLYLKAVAAREVDRMTRLQTVSTMSYGTSEAEENERHDWACSGDGGTGIVRRNINDFQLSGREHGQSRKGS